MRIVGPQGLHSLLTASFVMIIISSVINTLSVSNVIKEKSSYNVVEDMSKQDHNSKLKGSIGP